ncbi:MAG: LacI family transcriptional regulator [Oscillospiraceae bacterium]|nr:LacI family transcriptional regulator [Oscillospiraceae bacterium]
MRPTIKDVAKRAGVSATTVSMVLNDPDNSISERTRKMVIRAVQELNYRPNRLAVSLVTKKTNIIGLVFPVDINSFQETFLNHIQEEASARGYTIIFSTANEDADRTILQLCDFTDRGVDGIILAQSSFKDPAGTDACLKAIAGLNTPIVLVDRVPEDCAFDMIKINDYRGGYDAIKYLLDLGHRKIGIITGPMYINNCVNRLAGCRGALEDAGIPFYDAFVFEGAFDIPSGAAALPYLLGQNITAVFAFNDMTAYGVYKEARKYNLSIPTDLSVIGFDDMFFSDIIYPPLTTVEFPFKKMAVAAVERLILRINGAAQATGEGGRQGQGQGLRQEVAPGTGTGQGQSIGREVMMFDPIIKVRGSTRRL